MHFCNVDLLGAYLWVCVVAHRGESHQPPPEGLHKCPGSVDGQVEGGVPPHHRSGLSKLSLTDVNQAGETQDCHTWE